MTVSFSQPLPYLSQVLALAEEKANAALRAADAEVLDTAKLFAETDKTVRDLIGLYREGVLGPGELTRKLVEHASWLKRTEQMHKMVGLTP
jgi:hypothetical protein